MRWQRYHNTALAGSEAGEVQTLRWQDTQVKTWCVAIDAVGENSRGPGIVYNSFGCAAGTLKWCIRDLHPRIQVHGTFARPANVSTLQK